MTHFLTRCKVCGIVISQCRCIGHKVITWEICKKCKGNKNYEYEKTKEAV